MAIDFKKRFQQAELGIRVRAIMGVPEEILEDIVISSPTFLEKASRYINKHINKYDEEQLTDVNELLNIAYLYYICYLLCSGMNTRLPKQMENKSTKTIMQSIDWDKRALDMLGKCDDILEDILEELDGGYEYGNTMAVLTEESPYPNELV